MFWEIYDLWTDETLVGEFEDRQEAETVVELSFSDQLVGVREETIPCATG
jgi:hypothetical protein